VAIGRAYLYGLAAGGYAGVDKALTLLPNPTLTLKPLPLTPNPHPCPYP
jgi:hypothetical protein